MLSLIIKVEKMNTIKPDTQRFTVNSLMFAEINVCVFETKPSSRGLTFAVSSGLVNESSKCT